MRIKYAIHRDCQLYEFAIFSLQYGWITVLCLNDAHYFGVNGCEHALHNPSSNGVFINEIREEKGPISQD